MQQMQRRFEHPREVDPSGRGLIAGGFTRNLRLDPLDVPIAELVPEEVIDLERGLVKAEFGECDSIDATGSNPRPAIGSSVRVSCVR
jgi:hypothetical protein